MRLYIPILFVFLITFSNSAKLSKEKYLEQVKGFQPTCVSCTALVSVISLVLKYDVSEPVVLEFANIVCKLFAKQTWTVCDGISSQFRDEFFYVFRQLAADSPSQVCGILLPDCADSSDPSESGWIIPLPPKSINVEKKQQKKPKAIKKPSLQQNLNILQLTDLHIDFEYAYPSEAQCDDPVCCRKNSGSFKKAAGYWGTVGKCDIPFRTVQNMLEYINSTQVIDYIIMTGDYINHVDWSYSIDEHLTVLRKLHHLVQSSFPTTPIFWSLGNHEGVPVNSFAPHSVDERFWPTWLYKELKQMSEPWLDMDDYGDISMRGSFATKLVDGLKIISLNTGFCEVTNFFLYLNQSDPDSTMSWFVNQLFESEKNGEKVQILAHIPPGNSECLEGWARNYYRVVQRFHSTISAQFFGHDHSDYFTLFYEDMHNVSSKPISVGYAAPSVTTFENMNPAFRLYEVDPYDGFKIVDFTTYTTNLEESSIDIPPVWKKLYSAKADYNIQNLSPKSWNKVAHRIFGSEKRRKQFLKYSYRTENPICDATCQFQLLCNLRMGHHNSSLYCPQISL